MHHEPVRGMVRRMRLRRPASQVWDRPLVPPRGVLVVALTLSLGLGLEAIEPWGTSP